MNREHVSKTLSFVLRHGAIKEKVPISPDGFVKISDLINYFIKKGIYLSTSDFHAIVSNCVKKRFELMGDAIRANQGHSLKEIKLDTHRIVLSPTEIPKVIHGTYMKNLASIKAKGLSRMNRNHIHCASSTNALSGMRSNCDLIVEIDSVAAMGDGIVFYISKNGVILTEGIDGVLPPKYLFFLSTSPETL